MWVEVCCSVAKLCLTLCDPVNYSTQGFSVLQHLPELAQLRFESVMSSNHLILCHFLILLPSMFPSITVFSNELELHIRWPEYWNFSFSVSPSSEYSGLIFFGIDWFDLLVVQGTLKSLLQNHNSKASIIWCSGFFMVQLSHPYITTGKTIDLTIWTFVSKVNGNISIYKESYFKSFAWYSVKMVKTLNLSMDWKFYKTLPNRDREGEREREKERRKEGEKCNSFKNRF